MGSGEVFPVEEEERRRHGLYRRDYRIARLAVGCNSDFDVTGSDAVGRNHVDLRRADILHVRRCPSMLTLTPSSDFGDFRPLCVASPCPRNCDRSPPVIVTHDFGAMPDWKLAAFTNATRTDRRLDPAAAGEQSDIGRVRYGRRCHCCFRLRRSRRHTTRFANVVGRWIQSIRMSRRWLCRYVCRQECVMYCRPDCVTTRVLPSAGDTVPACDEVDRCVR